MSSHSERSASRREAAKPSEIGALARELFERACHDDTFDDLKKRASFNRQDAGRLRHWIRAAQATVVEEPQIRA